MIRPVTLITFAAFIASGLYLYQVKHQAQLVDREIRKIHEATEAARDRAGVLRAEYALLNDPDRLSTLAATYLTDLKPTQPGQWSSMAELDRRLPPVGAPTAKPSPLEPDAPPEPTVSAHVEPPPAARPETQHAAHALAAPVPMASAEPAAPVRAAPPPPAAAPSAAAAPQQAAATAPRPAPRPVARPQPAPLVAQTMPHGPAASGRAQVAAAAPPALATQSMLGGAIAVVSAPLPPPRPAPGPSLLPRVSPPTGAAVVPVATRPLPRQDEPPTTTAEVVARAAAGVRLDPSVPVVASALGMARTMMAVSPVSPANASQYYPQGAAR